MCTRYMPATGHFVPTIHLEPKIDKLPLHVRGRIVLGCCFVAWTPIALGAFAVWSHLR
jgi:hypothetical protein